MSKIIFDKTGEKLYETGVKSCVLYLQNTTGNYLTGVAWNGITGVDESPSGGDATKLWADDIKYLSIRATEEYGGTISAYMYPEEFTECDGTAEVGDGVYIGQQERKPFGLCYRTTLGNDTELNNHGYKHHLVYGCSASPSSKSYQTINDSPEAITFSWEFETTPVPVSDIGEKKYKPTATMVIDSTKVAAENLKKLEDCLYGTDDTEPWLPLPDQVISILKGSTVSRPVA